jgi:hypothetical protein
MREPGDSSFVSALLHSKKEKTMKDERLYLRCQKKQKLVIPPPPLKKEKAWWELELELQAAYHTPDESKDVPG